MGHELIGDKSEREEISIGRDAVFEAFQGHVASIAEHAELVEVRGTSEIADAEATEIIEEKIVGFEIEMNDAMRMKENERLEETWKRGTDLQDGVEEDPDEGLGNGGLAREKGLEVREKERRKDGEIAASAALHEDVHEG